MPIDQVRSMLTQVGKALEFLHSRGIIHRDLKPENILTPTEAECKVGDFGLAVMQDKAGLLTRSIRGLGTPGYVSPEQQYGLKIDERTDQYSLAALDLRALDRTTTTGPVPSSIASQRSTAARARPGYSPGTGRRAERSLPFGRSVSDRFRAIVDLLTSHGP